MNADRPTLDVPAATRVLSLTAAAEAIAEGLLTARDLAEAQLARVEATDAAIDAWAHLDPARVRAEADRCDAEARAARGPLHGIGIGVKDIIATVDAPTEMGSPIYAGYRPDKDAECVARLEARGRLRVRQGGDDGIRVSRPVEDEESVEPASHAGRLVFGSRRGGRCGARRRRDRHANQRLGDPAGGLLRRRRVQADEGCDPVHRRAPVQRDARPARHIHAIRRRCRASGRRARRRRADRVRWERRFRNRRDSPTSTAFRGRRKSIATPTIRSTPRRRRCASTAPKSWPSAFPRRGAK